MRIFVCPDRSVRRIHLCRKVESVELLKLNKGILDVSVWIDGQFLDRKRTKENDISIPVERHVNQLEIRMSSSNDMYVDVEVV